jgi:hypothetical protein
MKKNIFVPTAQVIILLKKVKEKAKKEGFVKNVDLGFLLTGRLD